MDMNKCMCHVILSSRVRVYVVKHTILPVAMPSQNTKGEETTKSYETQTCIQALATRGHGHSIHDVHMNKHIQQP